MAHLNIGLTAFGASLVILAFKLNLFQNTITQWSTNTLAIAFLVILAIALFLSSYGSSYASIVVGFCVLGVIMLASPSVQSTLTSDQHVYVIFFLLLLIAFMFRRSIKRL